MISVFITWRKCLIGTVAHLALCASAPISFFLSRPPCGCMSLCAPSEPRDLLIRPLHSSRTKQRTSIHHISSTVSFFFFSFCHFSNFPSFFLEWPTTTTPRKNGQPREGSTPKKKGCWVGCCCGCVGWSGYFLLPLPLGGGCRLPPPLPSVVVCPHFKLFLLFFCLGRVNNPKPREGRAKNTAPRRKGQPQTPRRQGQHQPREG